MANTGSFQFQISGVPAANRDLQIEIENQRTGKRESVKPFLDGTATLRNLPGGEYKMRLRHPNLPEFVLDERPLVLYPGRTPTKVFVPLPRDAFRVHALADTPEADLAPIQRAAAAAFEAARDAAGKQPGDPIRAEDWNQLCGAVEDVASALTQLTRSVAPHGHDHPELKDYVDETRQQAASFVDSFGRRLAELERMIQAAAVRRDVTEALDAAQAVAPEKRAQIVAELGRWEEAIYLDPKTYGRTKKNSLNTLHGLLNEVRDAQADPAGFAANESMQRVQQVAIAETARDTPSSYKTEIASNAAVEAQMGSKFVLNVLGRRF